MWMQYFYSYLNKTGRAGFVMASSATDAGNSEAAIREKIGHDLLLSPGEAAMAADAFRSMADTNGDGRVTPEEYRAARAFILERY